MITLIKENYKRDYDVIVEVNKNGTITEVFYHTKNKDAVVKVIPYKINNFELKKYDRNYYNVIRSNKQHCQEYGGW